MFVFICVFTMLNEDMPQYPKYGQWG